MIRRLALVVALWSIAWSPAGAQDAPKDSPDQAAARAAVIAFADLLSEPDLAKAKAAFVGTDDDFKLVQNVHALMHTRTKLIAAVLKAMPNEKAPPGDDLTVEGLKKRIPQREVTIEGDTAMVGPDWKLKKVDGQWKVADIFAKAEAKKVATILFPAMTSAMQEAIPDVEAGKFKTPQEMEKAMRPKMEAAMKAMQAK